MGDVEMQKDTQTPVHIHNLSLGLNLSLSGVDSIPEMLRMSDKFMHEFMP